MFFDHFFLCLKSQKKLLFNTVTTLSFSSFQDTQVQTSVTKHSYTLIVFCNFLMHTMESQYYLSSYTLLSPIKVMDLVIGV